MTQDYNIALSEFEDCIYSEEDDELMYGACDIKGLTVETIRRALKLDHKIMQEPTDGMMEAANEADRQYQTKHGLDRWASVGPYDTWITMRDQMVKEMETGEIKKCF